VTYWVEEVMQGKDYKDLPQTPEKVDQATRALAHNSIHLARLRKESQYLGEV